MDDGLEVILLCFVLPLLAFVLIFSLIAAATHNDDVNKEKKQDKRYELCLKKNMQWVDGNCISGK
jgi:hypothetical protein